MYRVFTGIQLPKESKKAIYQQIQTLQEEYPSLKWVAQENLHLTLNFLGQIDKKTLTQVKAVLQKVREKCTCFQVTLTYLGAFPSIKNPRVLWVGLGEGKSAVTELHRRLEEGFIPLGFPRNKKKYHPHLTLARCRNRAPQGLGEGIQNLPFQKEGLPVTHITLFNSNLTPQGPIYKSLQSIELN